jgi:hypothetical protein
MQLRIRSFWDVNNAVLGLLYSLITAAVAKNEAAVLYLHQH